MAHVMDRCYPVTESSSNVMITDPSYSSSTYTTESESAEHLPNLSDITSFTFTPSSSTDAMCASLTHARSSSDSTCASLTHAPARSDSTNAMCAPLTHAPTRSDSSDAMCTPLTHAPPRSNSSDAMCTPLTHAPARSNSSDAMCTPLTHAPARSDSSDAMCTPLTHPPSRSDSSDAMCTSVAHDPNDAIMSTPKSENTRENTSNGHTSSFTHSHGLKPMSLFNSPSTGTMLFQRSPAPETEKDITIMCNISHLQHDEGDDTEQLIKTTLYKTKAAILISKVIKENHPALQEFDNLRSKLKAKMAKRQTPTHSEIKQYQKVLAQLHTVVTSCKDTLKRDTHEFEQEHYRRQGVFPQYSHFHKTLSLAKKLLITWKSFDI